MQAGILETDYLVIGAGAMGMAFADALLDEGDARVLLVDRRHRPGGHWNDAYPFVRLHQPSAFYGVNSRALGAHRKDRVGLNRGLYELASGQEVLDYFDQLMNQRLLPSGRVQWLPMCDHEGAEGDTHRLTSLLDGRSRRVRVARKVVHATHTATELPSTHKPRYRIAPGVQCVPPNALPRLAHAHTRYTVIGSGKTGMDACLWLLQNGADPSRIRWIMPNDAWFIDRANVQPGDENLERFFESLALQFECIAQAESAQDLLDRLEAAGQLLRLDGEVRPTKYRCATVSQDELRELRRIRGVVRLGRVRRIEPARLTLEYGVLDSRPDELYVDCSACAIPRQSAGVPVFEGEGAIHLQLVRTCAPTFSAAFIAAVESRVASTAEKNELCQVVPLPRDEDSWLRMWAVTLANRRRWAAHEGLSAWLATSRLDYGEATRGSASPALMERYKSALRAAVPRIGTLLRSAAPEAAWA
jgi:hypothetical protein